MRGASMSAAQRIAGRYLQLQIAKRVASGSSTPVLDELFRKSAAISSLLSSAARQTAALADEAEDSPSISILSRQADKAYKVIERLRKAMTSGDQEVSRGGPEGSMRQAKNFIDMLRGTAKAYDRVLWVVQEKSLEEAPKASHDLAVSVASLGTAFRQFVDAYGT
jgi:hypothetical protein